MTPLHEAEAACTYVADRVRRLAGSRWLQGRRRPVLPTAAGAPAVSLIAEHRLHRVPEPAAHALVAWARGERRVELLRTVPTARQVLALQARGVRCVSLLDDGASTAPHRDGLAFALHDLCHLEKLAEPSHRRGQIGFFALLDRAVDSATWRDLERPLDAAWAEGRDHVLADMNGSALFLLLTLKTKLRLAVARASGRPRGDPLGEHRQNEALETLFSLLELRGAAADAARSLSTKRDAGACATALLAHFEAAAVSS